ncbi:hypothetical protein [Nocardioides daeguensis]|nr:hypothetical protein [Nocardioides daeguensis]MBV6726756.1 hypothetical protein [Nocardioides daeguensis]MCR1774492.1 hypothetical protein [Nocardioides daeguensis]
MRREPHENVATVLVDPALLPDLELELVELDLWVWPVRSAPICTDGPRTEFQVRRRLVEAQRGAWDCAATWVPVWISFGERWASGDEPLPWSAHRALWQVLDAHADRVRFHRRLGGVRPLVAPVERRPAS